MRSNLAQRHLRLRDARSEAPTALLLGARAGPSLPCGTSMLVPDLAGGIVVPSRTDAAVPAPLPAQPCPVGSAFYAQRLTIDGVGSSCPSGVSSSGVFEADGALSARHRRRSQGGSPQAYWWIRRGRPNAASGAEGRG
ncbi:MAG: hypothetical protein AAF628_07175 [Planctomycetota bacterium]